MIHDSRNLDIRYEVVDLNFVLGTKASWRTKNRFLEKRRKHFARILKKLSRRAGKCKTAEECGVAALFGPDATSKRFKKASRSVRTQFGLADRFRRGIEVSGIYIEKMRNIFTSYGLPLELLVLPHVESSFNVKAYSKYGAAGIWQFTRSTGRRFMKINYSIDERRDPIISTHAAAKLLKRNFKDLKSWPLAITAYNHGRRGMMRAKKKQGDDIVQIVEKYKSRTFGFASRNFYAEFIAALMIMEDPVRYFGYLEYKEPISYEEVKLDHFLPVGVFAKHFDYDKAEIAALNPALRPSIWKGTRRIPKGYKLKVPYGTAQKFETIYSKLPSNMRFKGQVRPDWYSVKRGDSLSVIARRFRTSVAALHDHNDIDSRNTIYAGQKLRIPNGKNQKAKRKMTVARKGKTAQRVDVKKNIPAMKKDVGTQPKIVMASLDKKRDKKPSEENVMELTVSSVTFFSVPVEAPPLSMFEFGEADNEYGVLYVQPEETLGHYSHWAGISTMELRRFNGWTRRTRIHLGQSIMVPLHNVTKKRFESLRYEYQLSIFEDFFAAYSVDRVETVSVRKGQSLWTLSNEDYDVPLWLVRLYNQGRPLENLIPGQEIRIPIVKTRDS
ncbi:MAG: transglycosylase SLT domain-containing protein [Nitrospinota bacterium]